MRFSISIFVLLFVQLGNNFAQSDTTNVKVVGYVFAENNKEKLPFVHIVHAESGLGVISDTSGFFKIALKTSDTLIFRCMGYKSRTFALSDTTNSNVAFVTVPMQQNTFNLNQVDVMALSNKSQFKRDFINLKVENNEMRIMIPGVTKYLEREERVIPVQYTAMSPITALYFKYSKAGKSLQKFQDLLKQDAIAEQVAEKYNQKVLHKLSDFSGDTLQAFFDYMHLSNSYLLKSDEYDIYKRVLDSVPLYKLRLSSDTAFYNSQFKFGF